MRKDERDSERESARQTHTQRERSCVKEACGWMSTFDHYVTGLRYTSNTQTSPFLSLCVYVPLCWWCKLEPHHDAITVFQAHMPTNPHTVRVHPEPESQFNLGHMLQNWFWAGTYCTLLWTSVGHTFSCSKLLNCSLIIQSGIQCLLNNPWPTSYHWCSRRSFLDRLSKTYRKLTVQFDPSQWCSQWENELQDTFKCVHMILYSKWTQLTFFSEKENACLAHMKLLIRKISFFS